MGSPLEDRDAVAGLTLSLPTTRPSSMATPGEPEGQGGGAIESCVPTLSICLTKLDILDEFDEVKVGVAYKINGSPVEGMPGIYNDCVTRPAYSSTLPSSGTRAAECGG